MVMNALRVVKLRDLCFTDMMCLVFVYNPLDMFVFVFSWVRPDRILLLRLDNKVIVFL